MPSYLQIENISKSYGPKVLFDHIAFNINEGDKIALIAPNGTGKTSLLRILAGKDKSDSGGSIKFLRDVRIAFLEQDFEFDAAETVECRLRRGLSFSTPEEEDDFTLNSRRIMSELGLTPSQPMAELSGGEVKRVAITRMLAGNSDFLIMDEPTNHLDLDAIEYLENALKRSRCTLFMVTHDRYFLDRVCNTVMEMDRGSIYIYKGDYANYLEKRSERIANYNAETDKVRNLLRRELEWMHATPCARSGKAKYRKQAFWDLKERAEDAYVESRLSMSGLDTGSRQGNKVVNFKHYSFSYGDRPMVRDFSYNFQKGERVGIVGANGIGKSTFLNILTAASGLTDTSNLSFASGFPTVAAVSGEVSFGETLKVGYYRQGGMSFNEDDTVLDIVPDTHLLNRFLFPHDMFSNRISKLSGGERRRLYLLTILMQNPNMLVLDEPTNDLDIVTLNVLEEYLLEFSGTLVVVTHDRHFLDRIVDHLLVFCGSGMIKDFIGGYSEYRTFMKDLEAEQKRVKSQTRAAVQQPSQSQSQSVSARRPGKLSFKEKMELENLEKRIPELEAEKASLEALLNGGESDYSRIAEISAHYVEVKDELDLLELRWLELSSFL